VSEFYTISGPISEILPPREMKSKKPPFKPFRVYGAKVGAVEFEWGFKDPGHGVGTTINIQVEKKYGKYSFVGPAMGDPMATPLVYGGAGASGGAAPAGKSYNRAPFPVPHDHPDMSIIRQSALKAAVDIVSVGLRSEAMVKAGGSPAVPSITLDQAADKAITLAYKFAAFSSGQLDQARADQVAKAMEEKGS
jgi:hypothetical protein